MVSEAVCKGYLEPLKERLDKESFFSCSVLPSSHFKTTLHTASQWVLGGIYLIAGFLLLVDVFYFKPRRAGRLAARSAWELSSRLSAGEASGDSHSDPDA